VISREGNQPGREKDPEMQQEGLNPQLSKSIKETNCGCLSDAWRQSDGYYLGRQKRAAAELYEKGGVTMAG
jgi:hypothetical protein